MRESRPLDSLTPTLGTTMKIDFLAPNPAERTATLREIGPRANLRTTEKISKKGPDADLVWLHGDTEDRADWQLDEAQSASLRQYVEKGGRVLLTGPAASLVGPIAGEAQVPDVRRTIEPATEPDSADEASMARGVMPMPGHPLFYRSTGGRMFYERRPGEEYAEAVYSDGQRPLQGEVVAVEKHADGCRAERAVIVEYKVGQGRVVSVGAPLSFVESQVAESQAVDSQAGESRTGGSEAGATTDPLLESRARFVGDLLDYVMDDHAAEQGAPWRSHDAGAWIRWDSSKLLTQPDPIPAPKDAGIEATAGEELFFELSQDDGHVLYGDTSSETFEVWRQPFLAFRDFRYSFSVGEADWVLASAIQVSSRVHCDQVVQRFTGSEIDVECCVALAPRGFQVRWQNHGDKPIRIRVAGMAGLGLASPYPNGSLGDLDLVSSAKGAELKIADPVLGYGAWMRFDRIPKRSSLADQSTGQETSVRFTREFKLPKNGDLAMVLGGLVRDSFAVGGPYQHESEPVQGCSLPFALSVDDEELDTALLGLKQRAAAALRSYDGQSRGLTTGRLAGGQGTDAAEAGHFVGRGSLEFGTSLLAWGQAAAVREHLELLERFQDSRGQIFDQLSVSGVLLTGDAQSTSEFVQLVGRYLAWTGDHELVFELWSSVRRALTWLEGQDIGQGQVFRSGARIAEFVGEVEEAKRYAAHAQDQFDSGVNLEEGDDSELAREEGAVGIDGETESESWEESAKAIESAWRNGKPWDRVGQAAQLRLVIEQGLGLREDTETGTLVIDPSFKGGPTVVKFDNFAILGRTWSGELRRDTDAMELSVRQQGPALEIACKSVEECESENGFSKILFEEETVVRFSITPSNQS